MNARLRPLVPADHPALGVLARSPITLLNTNADPQEATSSNDHQALRA